LDHPNGITSRGERQSERAFSGGHRAPRAAGRTRFGNSVIGSAFTHVGGVLLVLFIIDSLRVPPPSTRLLDDEPSKVVCVERASISAGTWR